MKAYQGVRDSNRTLHVTVTDDSGTRPLSLRLDLCNHSPTGFEHGYGGSGPAQLALAILADHLRDDKRAVRLHQRFKLKVIAGLPRELSSEQVEWELSSEQIEAVVRSIEQESERQ